MRLRAIVALGAAVFVLAGCAEHRASQDAEDLARERAIDIGNELAAGVFIDGPDGVESGLDRARFGLDRADVVANGQAATVTLWVTHTVFIEGGGFSPEVEESAVICVEYTVNLEGGDTVIRETDCPGDVPSGEHISEASLGGDVEIDSHDAMRALNRFQLPPNGRINEYRLTAEAKEALPDAIAALEPLSGQDVVVGRDVVDALTQADVSVAVRTDARPDGVRFGADVGSGCIYGTVGPGVFDVEAGGYPSDGGPCIGGDYR
jgi:hypothetical protein